MNWQSPFEHEFLEDEKMNKPYDFKTGYVVYPDGSSGETGKKAPYLDHGTDRPDPKRYYSKEEADLEWQKLWKKVWIFAGIAQDAGDVGSYFRCDFGKESFVVIRTAQDKVQAFYNVCPHRGNRLVHNDFGRLSGHFQCSFHGWKFNLDGTVKQVHDEQVFRKEVLAQVHDLVEVKCEIWKGMVFITMNPDPEPLLDYLGIIPEHVKNYPLEKMRVLKDIEWHWDANWKTALEAFIEFYHADQTHPEVVPFSSTTETQYDLYDKGISRMIITFGASGPKNPDRNAVHPGMEGMIALYRGNPEDYKHLKGYEYNKAMIDTRKKWAERNGYVEEMAKLTDDQLTDDWNYHVFPTITLNIFADSMLIQSFRPHATDPTKSVYQVYTMVLPLKDPEQHSFDINSYGPDGIGPKGWDGSIRPKRVYATELVELGSVLSQDAVTVPTVQAGLQSDVFKGSLLSESESRIRHYLAEVDRYLGRR
jgi:phenylpropionate dioxygenase-like ring-hydroxylating dioxygenase large terminal subunit